VSNLGKTQNTINKTQKPDSLATKKPRALEERARFENMNDFSGGTRAAYGLFGFLKKICIGKGYPFATFNAADEDNFVSLSSGQVETSLMTIPTSDEVFVFIKNIKIE
jgi:hypothetical protein